MIIIEVKSTPEQYETKRVTMIAKLSFQLLYINFKIALLNTGYRLYKAYLRATKRFVRINDNK